MIYQNYVKLASLSVITLLGSSLIASEKALATVYDVDFSIDSFTATGTLETSGTGDLARGDFNFIDWEIFLDDGSRGIPEAILTPENQIADAPELIFGDLDVGDIVADSNTLSFSNINTDSKFQAFGPTDSTTFPPENGVCFGACTDSFPQTLIRISGIDRVNNTGAFGNNFVVFDAASVSVSEFSHTIGLLAVGGFIGISRLRKSVKSLKLK